MMCGAALAGDPPNLVVNPGFEDVSTQQFAKSWGVMGEVGKPDVNVTLDDKTAHTGARSVRLGENPFTFVICDGADIAVKPGTKYMVTWWFLLCCKPSALDDIHLSPDRRADFQVRLFFGAIPYQIAHPAERFP
ncbi:MAG: carbohydrate binding domain-containing protein [Pirellulaceae bacterium]